MSATDPANHKFFEAKPRLTGKVGAGGVASVGATTIPHTFVGLDEGDAYIVTVNRTDATGTTKNPASQTETFIGKVSSTNFINCIREVEGTAQAWAADTVLEILMSATTWNKLIEGVLVSLNEDGTAKSAIVTALKATGAEINTGTEDAKIATPKAIADSNLAFLADITDAQLATSDVTINNVSTSKHGFVPKAPNDTAKFLRGDGTWDTPGSAASDGWTSDSGHTWAYVSASSFTIAGVDLTSVFTKGTRLRFKQGGAYKYATVISSSFSTNTTVNIAVNTDYTIANAAITDNYYSYQANPQGYPDWFNYTPTGPTNTTLTGRYSVYGKVCFLQMKGVLTGTPNFGSMPTLPIQASASLLTPTFGIGVVNDAGTAEYVGYAIGRITSSGTTCTLMKNWAVADDPLFTSTVPITWANTDSWTIHATYEI